MIPGGLGVIRRILEGKGSKYPGRFFVCGQGGLKNQGAAPTEGIIYQVGRGFNRLGYHCSRRRRSYRGYARTSPVTSKIQAIATRVQAYGTSVLENSNVKRELRPGIIFDVNAVPGKAPSYCCVECFPNLSCIAEFRGLSCDLDIERRLVC